MILDAYHSVGIIPVDVRALGVDVLVGGVLKWLCGGPGGAFLWIHPSLRNTLEPKITGWVAHETPFAFDKRMKYARDVFRFLNGTPSIPALYASCEGAKIISKIGVDKVRAKSKHQTALLVDESIRRGFTVITPNDPEKRAGTVTIGVPHGYQVSRELLRRDIIVDYREGAGIRIAPHFYNSDEEIVYAVSQIKNILQTRAYKRHKGHRAVVT